MVSDKAIGGLMTGVGVIGILVEFIVLVIVPLSNDDVSSALPQAQYWALAIPIFLGVFGVLGIITWIGITMIKTPPPEMMEFEDLDEVDLEDTSEKSTKAKKAEDKPKSKGKPAKKKAAKKAAKKEEPKAEEASSDREIEDVDGVSKTVAKNLREAGIDTVAKLSKLSLEELLEIKGVGQKTGERIKADS